MKILIAFGFGVFFLFQNCAPINFSADPDAQKVSLASTTVPNAESCDSNLTPSNQLSLQCPTGTTGPQITVTRSIACEKGNWLAGVWNNPDYSSCKCAVPEQSVHPVSGLCECPTGKILSQGQCVVPTCDLKLKPGNLEVGQCPSGVGSTKRTRVITCNTNSRTWESSAWSNWDYLGCSCPVIGQILQSSTGTCACPTGQIVKNGRCEIPACDMAGKPATQENISCPSGSGTATRTRPVTCESGSTTWITGVWTNNFSSCTCPISGQVMNTQSGACSCPAGQVISGGTCQVPTCDPKIKPVEQESLNCPAGVGTAFRSRSVTCPAGTTTWITGSWTSNYSQCGCSVNGQVSNPANGTCACPAGQVVFNGSCRINDCDISTRDVLSQTRVCPNNSTGNYLETRSATCNKSTFQYSYTPWSANYSTCSCAVTGQTFNLATKSCECPAGEVVNNGRCEPPPKCPLPAPANVEYKTCPSGSGTASMNRTVSCAPGATTWSIVNGSWNYSNCACPIIGAQLNAANGTCSCTGGTYEVSGKCGTCAYDETYNAATKTCQKITCGHPDSGARVPVGTVYPVYTINTGASQAACDSSLVTLTCTVSGQWNGTPPATRYGSCQVLQRSQGMHCDIGGKWGWRLDSANCPAGQHPISADQVGGCADGAAPYIINGRMGCYHSNTDPRRRPECYSSDPRDECCFLMCSPAGEPMNWTCNDYFQNVEGYQFYMNTFCTNQFGGNKVEYKNPPPPPIPPPSQCDPAIFPFGCPW